MKVLALVPTDESKGTLKRFEEIKDLIRSIINTSDNYDEKYVKIKLNLDNDLPLKKTVIGSTFHEGSKYYLELDEC